MVISGRLEYRDKRYSVGIVRRDKLIQVGVFVKVFELVDDNVDGALSWFFVHLFMKARGKVKGILPSCLAVYGGSIVRVVEVVPKALHVILGISQVTSSGVRLS